MGKGLRMHQPAITSLPDANTGHAVKTNDADTTSRWRPSLRDVGEVDDRLILSLLVDEISDEIIELARAGTSSANIARFLVARTGGEDRRSMIQQVRRDCLWRSVSGGPGPERAAHLLTSALTSGLFASTAR